MSTENVDQAAQRLGLTAPRVTLADLEANIVDIEFVKHVSKSGQVLRWAVLSLRNGFAHTGEPSASVSPENDSQELGEKYALENARRSLWALMGYQLREDLWRARFGIGNPYAVQAAPPPFGQVPGLGGHDHGAACEGLVDPDEARATGDGMPERPA